jgi:hypothetical protein
MSGLSYSQLSQEKLAKLFSRSFYTIDGLWFTLLERKHGLDFALDIDTEVWRRLGLVHARRLLKTFAIRDDSPIRTLVSMLQIDPVLVIYKPEIVTLTSYKTVFRCTDCPPQKARIRDGRGKFPCKPVGIALFTSYARVVDSRVKLSCLVCPPDPKPPQFWCEWQFEI